MHDYPVDTVDDSPGEPTVVSVPDVHGYLDAAERALSLPAAYGMDPVVEHRDDGMHWADNDYVAVFNGDLVDRGPDSAAVLDTVRRLRDEAEPGQVVQTLGNHEAAALLPDEFGYDTPGNWTIHIDDRERDRLLADVADGYVTAAFEGHTFRYSHAGRPDRYSARIVNERLQDAGKRLHEGFQDGGVSWRAAQDKIVRDRRYGEIFDRPGERQPSGLIFGEFPDLGRVAPPQVVGHTPGAQPRQEHGHINGNTIQRWRGRPGDEAVVVEEPDDIYALARGPSGAVERIPFEMP